MKIQNVRVVVAALVALSASAHSQSRPKESRTYKGPPTRAPITAGDLKTRLYIFADDSMRGRAAGTPDNLRGTNYIEREVRKLGLKPGGEKGTYRQEVPVIARRIDRASVITVDGKSFALGVDFIPRDNGDGMRPISGAQVIYGGVIGDTLKMLPRAAANGKVVLLTQPTGWSLNRPALTARYSGAAALAVATMDSIPRETLQEFLAATSLRMHSDALPSPRPAFVFVSNSLASALLSGSEPSSVAVGLVGKTVGGKVAYTAAPAPARNIIAILPGSDPSLRGQFVAVGAHNDHDPPFPFAVDHDSVRSLQRVVRPGGVESEDRAPNPGEWARINSMIDSIRRIRPPRLDSIKNGADDDGSGSMGVLEIAEAFARSKVRPRRSILFVWHTGEELGLYGSEYFTDHPTVPRDSIVAQLNIDMIGRGGSSDVVRLEGDKPVYGGPSYVQTIGSRRLSKELGDIVEAENLRQPITLDIDHHLDANGEPHQYYCRSDHYNYARYGIPVVFFFDGGHHDYHEVTDEPQYIDYAHYARIVGLVHDVLKNVANLDHRVVVDKPKPDPKGNCVQ